MFKSKRVADQNRAMREKQERREDARKKREFLASQRAVYDYPPNEERKAELRMALAVDQGTPWLAAVVDVIRQLQSQHMDVIASRPGTAEAEGASYRYSELRWLETALLDAVDRARSGAEGGGTEE